MKPAIGYRKLWLGSCSLLVSVLLLVAGYIDGSQWVDLFKWVFSATVAGNVGEHFSKKGLS